MLDKIIPDFDHELAAISHVSPPGFVMAFNVTLSAEYYYSTYPKAWQDEYVKGRYLLLDPVMFWMRMNSGQIRWSEVRLPDVRDIFGKAKKHGLNYGAAFAISVGDKLSFLSCSRKDREFTDEEMNLLHTNFIRLAQVVFQKPDLSREELDVIRGLAAGASQKELSIREQVHVSTIKNRISSAQSKLGAKNSTQLVALATRLNLF